MPLVALVGAYRFFFYSNENDEPPHIHVQRDGQLAKFWLLDVSLAESKRFSGHELRDIERMVEEGRKISLEAWHEFFGDCCQPFGSGCRLTEDELVVRLVDGRTISVPLAWFPRLLHATADQRVNLEILGDGEGIHLARDRRRHQRRWLLRGIRAPRTSTRRA